MPRVSQKEKNKTIKKVSFALSFDLNKKEEREVYSVIQDFKPDRLSEAIKPYILKAIQGRIFQVMKNAELAEKSLEEDLNNMSVPSAPMSAEALSS
jgi:hypothetical protein